MYLTPTTPKGLRQEAAATRDAAQRLLDKADEMDQQADDLEGGSVVQVVFGSKTSSRYAYRTGGLSVRVGDEVIVPSSDFAREQIVRVVDVGRGGYLGPLKTITGRVIRGT